MRRKSRLKVFVTRPIDDNALALLRTHAQVDLWPREMPPPARERGRRIRCADAVLSLLTDRIDANMIARAPRLRVISNMAVGVDNIDLEAATRAAIAVGHTPGILTETTADLAFALLMAAARRIVEADRYVRAGRWRTWGPKTMLGRDVYGATLGIVGWGAIGQAMARRASGFGMRVLYTTRARTAATADRAKDKPFTSVSLDRLLRESDFVSLHVPLTARTHHLVGAREFAKMRPGAILINTARGPVVDQNAMCEALNRGHLGGAALDVTDPEPIGRGDSLLKFPNVVITPHIGSASEATRRRMAEIAVQNILDVFSGRKPRFCANPDVELRR